MSALFSETVRLHPADHPTALVRRMGFPLDHPYLEHCWTPILGPTSVLFLGRTAHLDPAEPTELPLVELARQLGLGHSRGRNGPIWRTLERVAYHGFARWNVDTPGQLAVYRQAAPLSALQLNRCPSWTQGRHDELLDQHIKDLAHEPAGSAGGRLLPGIGR